MSEVIYGKNEKSKKVMFSDVDNNQFFYNRDGDLCQKLDRRHYFKITDGSGVPHSLLFEFDCDFQVKYKCREIIKISFDIEE